MGGEPEEEDLSVECRKYAAYNFPVSIPWISWIFCITMNHKAISIISWKRLYHFLEGKCMLVRHSHIFDLILCSALSLLHGFTSDCAGTMYIPMLHFHVLQAMVLFVGARNFKAELSSSFSHLCCDPHYLVRRSVAAGFHEVKPLVGRFFFFIIQFRRAHIFLWVICSM